MKLDSNNKTTYGFLNSMKKAKKKKILNHIKQYSKENKGPKFKKTERMLEVEDRVKSQIKKTENYGPRTKIMKKLFNKYK